MKSDKQIKWLLFGTFTGANLAFFNHIFPKPVKVAKIRKNGILSAVNEAHPVKKSYDCAIVCGCPAKENGEISDYLRTRVEKGVALYRAGAAKKLIFSGAAVKNSYAEAGVMKEYALSLGVLEDDIFWEPLAVSTYHNILYSRKIMEEQGFKDAVVVTNSWHLRKADHYAKKFGLDYCMCAADEPAGKSPLKTFWYMFATNIHMYYNYFRGLS